MNNPEHDAISYCSTFIIPYQVINNNTATSVTYRTWYWYLQKKNLNLSLEYI
jgi:hypothetical protein